MTMDKTDLNIAISTAMMLIEKGMPYRAYARLSSLLSELHGLEWIDDND